MGHHNGQSGAGHSLQHQGWAVLDLNQDQPRFILLGGVASKAWPVSGTGDQFAEVGEHLATVANSQAEGIAAFKKRSKLFAQAGVEKNRLGPALPGTEDIAVGEATAGRQALKIRQ